MNSFQLKAFLFLGLLFASFSMHAEDKVHHEGKNEQKKKDEKKEDEPPAIGNFSLSSSQQPYGLFAFGGNVIDKGETQLFVFSDEFVGQKKFLLEVIPSYLYGITNELSLFLNFPFSPSAKDQDAKSSGWQDFFFQLEYAFYNKKTSTHTNQATLVGSLFFPTGSSRKDPPTGLGSPGFFLGGTFTHMRVDWFTFSGLGALLTTSSDKTKFADQLLYQFGFGRNFKSPSGWIYAWMIEIDGQYGGKNQIQGQWDPNSGGNVIYATPSLWISSKDILIQFGVSYPITQHLFGKQTKYDYALNLNFAWSFYEPK